MSSIGTMQTTPRNKSGRCVIAAPTSSPEFDPPKIASWAAVVRPSRMSHSAAERKSSYAVCRLRRLAALCQASPNSDPPRILGKAKRQPLSIRKATKTLNCGVMDTPYPPYEVMIAGWQPPARTFLQPTRYIGILVPSLDAYQTCLWLTSDRPAGTVFFAHSVHSFLSGE